MDEFKMTDKELLIYDLSRRLNGKQDIAVYSSDNTYKIYKLCSVTYLPESNYTKVEYIINDNEIGTTTIDFVKPILKPCYKITKKELDLFNKYLNPNEHYIDKGLEVSPLDISFSYIDIRELIPIFRYLYDNSYDVNSLISKNLAVNKLSIP